MDELKARRKYNLARKLVLDLEKLIHVFDLNIKGLTQYKHYTPVARTLAVIKVERDVLNKHLEEQRMLILTKGKPGKKKVLSK